tara:strand:+ start:84 stop:419 length:336 start_codon:yes stop_codon:yes gene_type:complete
VVNRVPYFKTGTVTDGATATVAFDNLTDEIQIWCVGGAGALQIGVTTAGFSAGSYISLALNNSTQPIGMQIKQVVFKAVGADMSYQILAVLNRSASATYPDLTTANGFEGV